MRKFLLISVCTFAFNLNAANMVPVLSDVPEDKQNDVYSIILHNSLPTATHPEYRIPLSKRDITQIVENPRDFLTNRIQEVCPAAKVRYIPKSLWQLFGYYNMLKTLVDTPTRASLAPYFSRPADKSIIFLQPQHCFDLYPRIKAYNESSNVRNMFWRINELILERWHDDLGTCTDTLLDGIIDEAEKLLTPSSSDTPESKEVKELCQGGLMIGRPFDCLQANREMIKRLIMNESRARGYTIIRSEHPVSDPSEMAKRSGCSSANLCFSDGVCSGWVKDFASGCAIGFAHTQKRVMMSIELPIETMFYSPWFWIPPVVPLGAVMGCGEFYHVRTLASLEIKVLNSRFDSVPVSEITKTTYPMLFGNNCNIWPQLRFIETIEFDAPIKTLSTYVLEPRTTEDDKEKAEEPLPVAAAAADASTDVGKSEPWRMLGITEKEYREALQRQKDMDAVTVPSVFERERKRRRLTLTSEQQRLIEQALNYDNEELTVLTSQLIEEWNEQTVTQLRKKMEALDNEAIAHAN